MKNEVTTDVVIIGAGPTGLMLVNQLKRFGVSFIVIDSKAMPTLESRAMSVTSRSMELYQQLNLSDKVLEQSLVIGGFAFYNNAKKIAEASLAEIGNLYSDFGRMTTTFEQNKNETILYENLQEEKNKVWWNNNFIALAETKEGIIVEVENKISLEKKTINAQYIIGCDGARSVVRHQRNFTFKGGTYETKFYVADVCVTWQLGYDKIVMAPAKGIFVAFFPLQGEKRMRIVGTLPAEFTDKEEIDFEILETIIKKTSKFDLNFDSVGWHSVYKVHHRCVDEFSKGRIFLAGDAAHVHSPAGGQGMNTGLQDAHNLGWKLALVINGIAKPTLLNTYNEERFPFAQSLVKYTDKGFTVLASGHWFVSFLRTYIILPLMGKLMKFYKPRLLLFKKLSQLFYSYKKHSLSFSSTKQKLLFKAGDRLPYIHKGYFNNFEEPVFHLVCISDVELSEANKLEIQNTFPFDIKIVENKIAEGWQNFGLVKELFILVRPDQYILYISDSLEKAVIDKHLGKYFSIDK
jgi:2-polyprenyl-6-methoxyphenol hydroxylase-like FAD-dependent oxidoreductase